MGGRAYLLPILVILIFGLVHPSAASDEELITLRGIVTDFENRQLIYKATPERALLVSCCHSKQVLNINYYHHSQKFKPNP